MKELLQNHPNSQDFPVRKWRMSHELYKEEGIYGFVQYVSKWLAVSFILVSLLTFFAAVLFGVVAKIDQTPFAHVYFYLTTLVIVVIGVVMSTWLFLRVINTPCREQKRYYALANLYRLDDEKRQALRLDLVNDWNCGFWSETLEYYPLLARVRLSEDQFHWLPLADAKNYQHNLYEDWGIFDKDGFVRMTDALRNGMHSAEFAHVMQFESHRDDLIRRLSNLTEIDESWILACTHSSDHDRPPKWLWGFDLLRIIRLCRNSFSAGIISERLAWETILDASAMIFSLFESVDDFQANYRLGHAFWCNDFEMIKARLDEYRAFQERCDWPQSRLPWPIMSSPIYPPAILLDDEEVSSLTAEDYLT